MNSEAKNRTVVLDHGTGGLLSNDLVTNVIVRTLGDAHCGQMEDSFTFDFEHGSKLAITTDSFVITPYIFGNGDIGKIAVCGTVNDLLVSGAIPKYLTLALVLEEGFPIADLIQILESIKKAANEADVKIVAGDTKVVRKGEVDNIIVNTSGVGFVPSYSTHIKPRSICTGDDIILTSYIGDHSIHILSIREGLGFEERVLSDCAPLNQVLLPVTKQFGPAIHCMRDVTRGGLGSILNEIAAEQRVRVTLDEDCLPVRLETKMASEMLGISPMYLANEGCVCIFADPSESAAIVDLLREYEYGKEARVVGQVSKEGEIGVYLKDANAKLKVVDHLQGMELPRLC